MSPLKGLKVTLINWSRLRPCVTELYPEIKPNLPERYRGVPCLPVDEETGTNRCIACGACARICPQHIITVEVDATDPKNRKPKVFKIDIASCMWCGLCSEVCPKNCLESGNNFELACYTREDMLYDLPKLEEMGGTFKPEPKAEEESSDNHENPKT